MQRVYTPMILAILLASIATSGCQSIQPLPARSDAIYQVSVLDGLMLGDYDGTVSVGTLRRLGDTGLGTFNHLDGELVMAGGVVYKAKSDGSVELQPDSETVPFAVTTFLDGDFSTQEIAGVANIDELKSRLDEIIGAEAGDFNRFYMATVTGDFPLVYVRSVPAQETPYRPLAEVTAEQPEFNYENLAGTLVAARFPAFMEGINLPGWHIHFISNDKSKGGHVLDVAVRQGNLTMDSIAEFAMKLPETAAFAALPLSEAANAETGQVESKK